MFPELVPDVIPEIFKGSADKLWNLKNFRLVSKTWNEYIKRRLVGKTSVMLQSFNMDSFLDFVSGPSFNLKISSLKAIRFRLGQEYEKTLSTFLKLPPSFRSQLIELEIFVETTEKPTLNRILEFLELAELDSLEELTVKVAQTKYELKPTLLPLEPDTSQSPPQFKRLKKLTIPLHCAVPVLKVTPGLTHLTLDVYEMGLGEGFWEPLAKLLPQSLSEFGIVEKRRTYYGAQITTPYALLTGRKFRLRKLILELPFLYKQGTQEADLCQLLNQQAPTLESLGLPPQAEQKLTRFYEFPEYKFEFILKEGIRFPRLRELGFNAFCTGSTNLLQACPRTYKVRIPAKMEGVYPNRKEDQYIQEGPFEQVEVIEAAKFKPYLLRIFPNALALTVTERITSISDLTALFTRGSDLLRLEVKVGFINRDICPGNPNRIWLHPPPLVDQRKIRLDAFLLGLKMSYCNEFYDGRLQATSRTDFEQPEKPSLTQLERLEYLNLEGHFTELAVWAGFAKLTQLKELVLASKHAHKPNTFLELEAFLPNLERWSFTKVAESRRGGERKAYTFGRVLPNGYGQDQILVTKFNDNDTEEFIVRIDDFEKLDLSYTGIKKKYHSPENLDSDSDSDYLESDSDPCQTYEEGIYYPVSEWEDYSPGSDWDNMFGSGSEDEEVNGEENEEVSESEDDEVNGEENEEVNMSEDDEVNGEENEEVNKSEDEEVNREENEEVKKPEGVEVNVEQNEEVNISGHEEVNKSEDEEVNEEGNDHIFFPELYAS